MATPASRGAGAAGGLAEGWGWGNWLEPCRNAGRLRAEAGLLDGPCVNAAGTLAGGCCPVWGRGLRFLDHILDQPVREHGQQLCREARSMEVKLARFGSGQAQQHTIRFGNDRPSAA